MITFKQSTYYKHVEIRIEDDELKESDARNQVMNAFNSFLLAAGYEPMYNELHMSQADYDDFIAEAWEQGRKVGREQALEEAVKLRQAVKAHQADFEELEKYAEEQNLKAPKFTHFPLSDNIRDAFVQDMDRKAALRSECGLSCEDQMALNEFLYGEKVRKP